MPWRSRSKDRLRFVALFWRADRSAPTTSILGYLVGCRVQPRLPLDVAPVSPDNRERFRPPCVKKLMKPDLLTMQLADAQQQRIRQTELALLLSEKMVAENLALSSRIRSARQRVVKSEGLLTKIDPTALSQFAQ